MMIARSAQREGNGGKSLLKIGEVDKVGFDRIETSLYYTDIERPLYKRY